MLNDTLIQVFFFYYQKSRDEMNDDKKYCLSVRFPGTSTFLKYNKKYRWFWSFHSFSLYYLEKERITVLLSKCTITFFVGNSPHKFLNKCWWLEIKMTRLFVLHWLLPQNWGWMSLTALLQLVDLGEQVFWSWVKLLRLV